MQDRNTSPIVEAARDADGGLTVTIETDRIAGTDAAGLMLADIAGHLANAMAAAGKAGDSRTALVEILTAFEAELRSPTDTPVGGMLKGGN